MLVLTQAGICFDFGHTFWNVEHHMLDPEPPAEFLQRTIHTHIHDIGTNGTHYPLNVGTVPLAKYVGMLKEAGYSGVYNLELGCHRFAEEYEIPDAFFSSVDILKQALDA